MYRWPWATVRSKSRIQHLVVSSKILRARYPMSSESPVPFTAPSQLPSSGSIVTRCAEHPDVETGLRCGRCETPICPQCLIMTPVGARCETCADVRPSPIFTAGRQEYKSAILTGVGVALASGWLPACCRFDRVLWPDGNGGGWLHHWRRGFQCGQSTLYNRSEGCSGRLRLAFVWRDGRSRGSAVQPDAAVTAPGAVVFGILGSILGILLSPFSLLAAGLAIFLAVNRI